MLCKCLQCNTQIAVDDVSVVHCCPCCGTTASMEEPGLNTNGVCLFSKNAAKCAVGGAHYFVLLNSGLLYGWGENAFGQLTLPKKEAISKPQKVLSNIVDVAAGDHHAIALLTDGTVLTWGDGTKRQLGRGWEPGGCVPRKVDFPCKTKAVYAASNASAALLDNGEVYAWGECKQSDGTTTFKFHKPTMIAEKALSVHLTRRGVLILSEDNRLTGLIEVGSRGNQRWSKKTFQNKQINSDAAFLSAYSLWYAVYLLDAAGNIHAIADLDKDTFSLDKPQKINVASVFSFSDYAYFLYADGRLTCDGGVNPHMSYSSSEEETFAHNIVSVAASAQDVLLTDTDGRVYAWGSHVLVKFQSKAVLEGYPIKLLDKCAEIECGRSHYLALDAQGNVFAWGENMRGQLGRASRECSYVPIRVRFPQPAQPQKILATGDTSILLDTNGNLWMWGALSKWLFESNQVEYAYAPQIAFSNVKRFFVDVDQYERSIELLYLEYLDDTAVLIGNNITKRECHDFSGGAANYWYETNPPKSVEPGAISLGVSGAPLYAYDEKAKELSPDADEDETPLFCDRNGDVVLKLTVAELEEAVSGGDLDNEDTEQLFTAIRQAGGFIKNGYWVLCENASIVWFDEYSIGMRDELIGFDGIIKRSIDGTQSYSAVSVKTPYNPYEEPSPWKVSLNPVLKGVSDVREFTQINRDPAELYVIDGQSTLYYVPGTNAAEHHPIFASAYQQPIRDWESADDSCATPHDMFSMRNIRFTAAQLAKDYSLLLDEHATLWIAGNAVSCAAAACQAENECLRPKPVLWGVRKILQGSKYIAVLCNDGTVWEYGEILNRWFGVPCRKMPFSCAVQDVCAGSSLTREKRRAVGESCELYYALLADGTVWSWQRLDTEDWLRWSLNYSQGKEEQKEMEELFELYSLSSPFEQHVCDGAAAIKVDDDTLLFCDADGKVLFQTNFVSSGALGEPASVDLNPYTFSDGVLYTKGDWRIPAEGDGTRAVRQGKTTVLTDVALYTVFAYGLWDEHRFDTNAICCDTIAMRTDGSIYAWGKNSYGQLGTGDKKRYLLPQCVSDHSRPKMEKTVIDYEGEPFLPDVVQISSLGTSVHDEDSVDIALDESGRVWCWGNDRYRASGDDGFYRLFKPKLMADNARYVCAAEGGLWRYIDRDNVLWHFNGSGFDHVRDNVKTVAGNCALLLEGGLVHFEKHDDGYTFTPVLEDQATPVASVYAQKQAAAAILEDGTAWVWGRFGTYSYQDKDSVSIEEPRLLFDNAVEVDFGVDHDVCKTVAVRTKARELWTAAANVENRRLTFEFRKQQTDVKAFAAYGGLRYIDSAGKLYSSGKLICERAVDVCSGVWYIHTIGGSDHA